MTRTLYAELEGRAHILHIDRLYTEASEPARRFFERAGFAVDRQRQFEFNGVAIHNYAMSKPLHNPA